MQGRGARGPIKGRFHRLAIQRDEGALGERRDRLGPGQKALLKAARIEAGKDAAKGIVGGNPVRQGEEGLKPRALALAKEFHVLEPFPAGQQRAYSDHQDIEEVVLLCSLNAWVLSGLEMLEDRRVDGVSHATCSSAKRCSWQQHSMVCVTGVVVPLV